MGKSPWTKEYDETLADTFIPIDKYLKNEPTEMQLKYHPKYDPCPDYPDLEQQNEGYPAHRTPEQQAKYNAARFDPHDFQECRFLPQKGMCVFNIGFQAQGNAFETQVVLKISKILQLFSRPQKLVSNALF